MHICSTTDARRDIVNIEVKILVNAGLESERSNNAGFVIFLCCLDILFGKFKSVLQQ